MKHKEIENRIAVLLEHSKQLRSEWIAGPELAHIPFKGNRQLYFLHVGICAKPDWVDRERQVKDCLSIAQVAIGSDLLTDEVGIEVSAWVNEPRRMRAFRLDILQAAYVEAKKVSAADLLNNHYAGISCQWPLKSNRTRQS